MARMKIVVGEAVEACFVWSVYIMIYFTPSKILRTIFEIPGIMKEKEI